MASLNPLLTSDPFPRFAEIRPEHVLPAVEALLEESEAALRVLEANPMPTWEGLMEPIERIERRMSQVWGAASALGGVANSPELRDAIAQALPRVVAFDLRMSQSEPLYAAMKSLRDSEQWESLDCAKKRALEISLREARLSGIALQGAERERFNEISRRLSDLSLKFRNNLLDATKAYAMELREASEVEGLPQGYLALASQRFNQAHPEASGTPEKGPWLVSLDVPSYMGFMRNSRRRDLREKLWRANAVRASEGDLDNSPLLAETLRLRQEKARLLGFPTFAALSVSRKMAQTVEAVDGLMAEIRTPALKRSKAELAELAEFARSQGQREPIEVWDVGFWTERLKEHRFQLNTEELRPYFPQPRVLEGLFALVKRLFDVSIEPADGEVQVWHPDVRFFAVKSPSGERLASLYMDLYTRPASKGGGAWMSSTLQRQRLGGELMLPVATVCANNMPPVGDRPALLSLGEVTTLFHELGHALQHMLTTVECGSVSGTSGVEWDAVELASQFMENWCYETTTLKSISAHVDTGEPLPDAVIARIQEARTFASGYGNSRMVLLSEVDMDLHHRFEPQGGESPIEVYWRAAERASPLQPPREERFLNAFTHIFAGGYAAGYYSYLWAEVLSADAFAAFEEAGLENEEAQRELGRRYRDTVLALGGSRHPSEVFALFRGRAPQSDAFLRSQGLL